MLKRQTGGSVVCPSCGRLVGVRDAECHNCGRRNPGMWGFTAVVRRLGQDLGFTNLAFGACLALYLLTLLVGGIDTGGGIFGLLSPRGETLFLFGASGAIPVFQYDRWWTPLSAGWLHGGLLHIGFNLYWLRQLGPTMGELYGPGRSIVVYVVSSVVGFLASSLAGRYLWAVPFLGGAGLTVGASAAIFGWLGALVHFGRRTGSRELSRQILGFAVPMFIIGLLLPIMDNWAHLGGFACGWGLSFLFDPAKQERIDHVLLALVCLALSVLSIVVSVLHGMTLPIGRGG
jgi:rhomboid protease GluP